MEEIWLKTNVSENYEVSNFGRIRSVDRIILINKRVCNYKSKILSPKIDTRGYYSITLSINKNTKKTFQIHRLVAIAFIDNPLNKKEVNHIDGNKLNPFVGNLEWVTPSENLLHSYRVLKRKPSMLNMSGILAPRSKKVYMYLNDILIKTFNSAKEASDYLGLNKTHVSASINNNHKCKGYKFKYE